jgi:hypothetical protein
LEVAVTVEQQVPPELPVVVAQVLRSALLPQRAVVEAQGNKALLRESLVVLVVEVSFQVAAVLVIPRLYHHLKVALAALGLLLLLTTVAVAVEVLRL